MIHICDIICVCGILVIEFYVSIMIIQCLHVKCFYECMYVLLSKYCTFNNNFTKKTDLILRICGYYYPLILLIKEFRNHGLLPIFLKKKIYCNFHFDNIKFKCIFSKTLLNDNLHTFFYFFYSLSQNGNVLSPFYIL